MNFQQLRSVRPGPAGRGAGASAQARSMRSVMPGRANTCWGSAVHITVSINARNTSGSVPAPMTSLAIKESGRGNCRP